MYRRVGSALLKAWPLALAIVFVGGVAVASIPDATGVIHGCYKLSGNQKGLVRVIDTGVTTACPTGFAPLNWNQAGPPGPAVQLPPGTITGAHMIPVTTGFIGGSVPSTLLKYCPTGELVISGTAFINTDSGGYQPLPVKLHDQTGTVPSRFGQYMEIELANYTASSDVNYVYSAVTCGVLST